LVVEICSIANDTLHERPCNNELAGDSKANILTVAFAKKLNSGLETLDSKPAA
jgi:hypothetical protein